MASIWRMTSGLDKITRDVAVAAGELRRGALVAFPT